MIVKISLKRVSVVIIHFIFSAVHVSSGLMAIFVLVIFWIVWKAKVVRSTTRVIVVSSPPIIPDVNNKLIQDYKKIFERS